VGSRSQTVIPNLILSIPTGARPLPAMPRDPVRGLGPAVGILDWFSITSTQTAARSYPSDLRPALSEGTLRKPLPVDEPASVGLNMSAVSRRSRLLTWRFLDFYPLFEFVGVTKLSYDIRVRDILPTYRSTPRLDVIGLQ